MYNSKKNSRKRESINKDTHTRHHQETSLVTQIKQNNIKLFEERKEKKNIVKAKLSLSQKSNSVVTNLFISSQQRNADLNNLFKHEISLPPPSFTTGEIHFSNKSKLVEILLPNEMQVPESEEAQTMIVDGSFGSVIETWYE